MQILKRLVTADSHRHWSALKSRHSRTLADHRIDFDAKFGPLLDKVQAQTVIVDRLFARDAVTRDVVEKVVKTTRPLRLVAVYYRDKIKGLGNPAEDDLATFLRSVESDCEDWEKVLDIVSADALTPRNTPQQLRAVRELYGTLDALGQQLGNLRRNLPKAATRARKIPTEAKYEVYTALVKKARGEPLAEKPWRRDLAADMQILGGHVEALDTLASSTEALLNRLVSGASKFDERSDYPALRDLARSLAGNSTLKDFKQRALALDQWMSQTVERRPDYVKGSMAIAGADMTDLRRVSISTAEAAHKLIDPVYDSVHTLP